MYGHALRGLKSTSSSLKCCRKRFPRNTSLQGQARRSLHERAQLPYPIEGGLGNFLGPEALRTIAVEYQEGLLRRLNEEVKGTAEENKSIVQTIVNTAQDRNKVRAFNYASLALNNSYFLSQLAPPPADEHNHEAGLLVSGSLKMRIDEQFGSLDQLKSTVGAAALGLFSSGWVWLVTDVRGNMGVLPTFGAGTLLLRSRRHILGADNDLVLREREVKLEQAASSSTTPPSPEPLGSSEGQESQVQPRSEASPVNPISQNPSPSASQPSSPVSGASHPPTASSTPHIPSRSFHTSAPPANEFTGTFNVSPSSLYSPQDEAERMARSSVIWSTKYDLDKIGETLYPLFALSVYEHGWLVGGYGVWGKEEYVRRFFSVVDWSRVAQTYNRLVQDQSHI